MWIRRRGVAERAYYDSIRRTNEPEPPIRLRRWVRPFTTPKCAPAQVARGHGRTHRIVHFGNGHQQRVRAVC